MAPLTFSSQLSYSRFCDCLDLSCHPFDAIIHFVSFEPQNTQSKRFQKFSPLSILLLTFVCEVAPAVYLDDKLGLVAVEVDNVVADWFLPLESKRQIAKPAIPKPLLRWSHVTAQGFGQLHIVMIVVDVVGML